MTIMKVGIVLGSPPHVTDCVEDYIFPSKMRFNTITCTGPGVYVDLFKFLALVMNVTIEWKLVESNEKVYTMLRSGQLDASARMKQQEAFIDDKDLTVCDYGLYEKTVYLLRSPAAIDMNQFALMAVFESRIWISLGVLFLLMIIFWKLSCKLQQTLQPEWPSLGPVELLFYTFSLFVKAIDFTTTPKFISELVFTVLVVNGLHYIATCYEYFVLDNLISVVHLDSSLESKAFYDFVLKNNYKIVSYPQKDSRFFRKLESKDSESSLLMNDLLFSHKRFLEANDTEQALDLLMNSNDRLMVPWELSRAKYFTQRNPGFIYLNIVNDPWSYSGFVFPRNSSYLRDCNYWMKKSGGIISSLIKKYVYRDKGSYLNIGAKRLKLRNITSLMEIWLTGLLSACILFILERFGTTIKERYFFHSLLILEKINARRKLKQKRTNLNTESQETSINKVSMLNILFNE